MAEEDQELTTQELTNQERRYLEIFRQLLQIPQFMRWMKKNIVIKDDVDHKKGEITTYVIYTPGKKTNSQKKRRTKK